jgi:hypothetical protein
MVWGASGGGGGGRSVCRSLTGVVKEVDKIKLVLVDIDNTVEEYDKALKKNQGIVDFWSKQLEDLQAAFVKNLTPINPHKQAITIADGGGGGSKDGTDAVAQAEAAAQQQQQQQQQEGKKSRTTKEDDEPRTLELLSPEVLSKCVKEDVQYKITMLEEERNALREKVNLSTIEECVRCRVAE